MDTELHVSKVGGEAPFDVHESPSDAGVFQFLGETWRVNDSAEMKVWEKEIHVFDPCFVPLIARRRYRSPAGTEIHVDYHVIGRYIENPQHGYEDANIPLPTVPRGFKFDRHKIQPLRTLWATWDPQEHPTEYANCVPPARVEFGPWVVTQLRMIHTYLNAVEMSTDDSGSFSPTKSTRQKLNEILEAGARKDQEEMDKAFEEARYRVRHNWRQFKKAADKEQWTEPPSDARRIQVDLGHKSPR